MVIPKRNLSLERTIVFQVTLLTSDATTQDRLFYPSPSFCLPFSSESLPASFVNIPPVHRGHSGDKASILQIARPREI
jgi:hypothetical protein